MNTMANRMCLRICSTALKRLEGNVGIITFLNLVNQLWLTTLSDDSHPIRLLLICIKLNSLFLKIMI